MKTKLLSASAGLLCFAFSMAPSAEAQIISAPDIGPIGTIVNQLVDLSPAEGIVPGVDGLNAVWNFIDLEGTVDQVLTLIDPASIPQGLEFPDANLAIDVNIGEGYLFLGLDPEKLQILGQVGDVDHLGVLEGLGLLDLTNIDLEVPLSLGNPAELLELPLQYADQFQSEASVVFELIDGITSDLLTIKRTVSVGVTVDAEGTVILPGPVVFDAIRLNKVVLTTDSIFIDILGVQVLLSVDVVPTYIYTWLTDAPELAGLPLVEMVYDVFGGEAERVAYFKSSSVGLKEAAIMNVQVFPNPSSNIASVQFEQVVSGTMMVYDSKGALISTQAIEGNSTRIDVSQMEVGLYQLQFIGEDVYSRANLNVIR